MASRPSGKMLKSLPPDPARHQDSAITLERVAWQQWWTWDPSYRLQWRQVVIAIPARRMQQDRLHAEHTIPPRRSACQASERPPCCHKESAVTYLLPILAEREPHCGQLRRLSRRDSGKVRPRVHTSVSMSYFFR